VALRQALLHGFELLRAGEQAISEELIAFSKRTAISAAHQLTPQFGELQRLLNAVGPCSEDLELFREFMRRFNLKYYPIPAGTRVFGYEVNTRRVHSLRTAAKAVNIRLDVLEELLIDRGVGHRRHDGCFEQDKPLTVETVESLRQKKTRFLSRGEAAKFLGASETVFKELQKSGVLLPRTGRDHRVRKGYDAVQLQALLDQVFADTKVMKAVPTGLSTLPAATRQAKCSTPDIIRLILSGRLKAAGRLGRPLILNNMLVSQVELLQAFPKLPRNGYTKTELCQKWSIAMPAINRLIEVGHLSQVWMKHSRSRVSRMLVPLGDVKAYERKHFCVGQHIGSGCDRED
jgi:hypothetical protein